MAMPVTISRPPRKPAVPLLRAGDRLTVEEFRRRYEAMPSHFKAELLDEVVYVPSPASIEDHGNPNFNFVTCLGVYQAHTPGVQGGENATVRLEPSSEPQPDGLLRILPEYGGQSQTINGYVVGAPELAAEVSASSVSYDLHAKLEVYRRHGVREYIVWRVEDEAIDWFVLRGDRYEPLPLTDEGWYKSEVFSGLWLEPAAILRGDLKRVLEVLQLGLASPEHAKFIERLQQTHSSREVS